jgi:hypothetical protein
MLINSFQSAYLYIGSGKEKEFNTMKITIFLTLLIYFIPVYANAATYYIDPSGSNRKGDGSQDQPWSALSYACTQVKNTGDTIHINAGTYTDNYTCDLAVGVNIQGADKDKVTINSYISNWYIRAISDTLVDGNQEISGFTLNGGSGPNDRRLERGIYIHKRNNVSIHHTRFQNIQNRKNNGSAVCFYGHITSWNRDNTVPPSQWATGCSFHDCIVSNCAGLSIGGDHMGALKLNGLASMEVYNNKFDESSTQGQCIKGVRGWLKGAKIFNNTFKVADESIQRTWHLGIELWNLCEDSEIYNNKFYNGLGSFVSGQKLNGTYSLYFHHNEIYNADIYEFSINDVLIEYNHFEGYQSEKHWAGGGISLWQTWASSKSTIKNWTAKNNVFYGGKRGAICITDKGRYVTFKNISIYNNVMDGIQGNGIIITGSRSSNFSNFKIKNNIFINCSKENIENNATINSLEISHNFDDYNKVELNYSGKRPDPYYRALGPNADVVDAGAKVGIPFTGSAPDVGAFEFGSEDIIYPPHQLRINSK